MKVAVVPTIRNHPWGAPGACMGELVGALVRAGHDVLWLVAPIDRAHPQVTARETGVRVVPLPAPRRRYGTFAAFRRRATAWRGQPDTAAVVDAFAPDHVFVNQGGTWCGLDEELFDVLQARPNHYSLLCHLNQHRPAFAPDELQRARTLMGQARRIFFNSAWTRRVAEMQLAQRIERAAIFQPPLRIAPPAPLPWPEGEVATLAMVTRLDVYHKGIDLALEAVAALLRDGVRLRLRIYGGGADAAYVACLVCHLGLGAEVELHPHTDDLARVWADAEMLLLPSRFEGLAVSMLEAMAYGRVVLRTPYGGAEEWLDDGVTGYLCPAPEVGLLCATLRRALAERPRWRDMGIRAFEKVARDRVAAPGNVFLEALATP